MTQSATTPHAHQEREKFCADNNLSDYYALPALILSVIIMAHSIKVGFISILAFYLLWLPQLALRPRQIVNPIGKPLLILLLPIFCTYSVFWSQEPARSLYFGIQFISMIICTIIIARTVSIECFLKGLALGTLLVLSAAISSNNYQRDFFTGEYALVGFFTSKNIIGLYANVCIFSGISILFLSKSKFSIRLLIASMCIPIGLASLYLSKSIGSLLTLFIVLGICSTAWLLTRFNANMRRTLCILGSLIIITIIVFIDAFNLDLQAATLQSVGKSSTLTGRTYLWAEGLKAAYQHPWLGWGYSAFWVSGQALAERYWNEFGVPPQSGFHFHNTYIQAFVDIGAVGLALLIGIAITTITYALNRVFSQGITLQNIFALGFASMFLTRSMVEVDFLNQFSISTLIIFSILPLLTRSSNMKNFSRGNNGQLT